MIPKRYTLLSTDTLFTTYLEVIDLTHQPNVDLFRRWDQKEAAFIQQLRFVRICSTNADLAVLSKPGKHPSLIPQKPPPSDRITSDEPSSKEMDIDTNDSEDAPLLLEPIERFSSTMMTMDGPI